jgi:hypothetical protein
MTQDAITLGGGRNRLHLLNIASKTVDVVHQNLNDR